MVWVTADDGTIPREETLLEALWISDDIGVSELLGMSDTIELGNTDDKVSTIGVDFISVPTEVNAGFSVASIDDVTSLLDDVRYSDTDDSKSIGSDDSIVSIDDGDESILVIGLSPVDVIGLFVSKMPVVCDVDISGGELVVGWLKLFWLSEFELLTLELVTVTMSLDDCMLGVLDSIGLSDKDIVSVGLFEGVIGYTALEDDVYDDISILEFTDIAILKFDVESMNMDDDDGEIDSPELLDETDDDG